MALASYFADSRERVKKSEVLIAVKISVLVFGFTIPFELVGRYQHF
jgi:hypothetical protein